MLRNIELVYIHGMIGLDNAEIVLFWLRLFWWQLHSTSEHNTDPGSWLI